MKKVNFVPAKNKVLVKVQEAATVSPGGIHIPDSGKEKPMEGVIFAIGKISASSLSRTATGNFKAEDDYDVKDIILFGKYRGDEIRVDEEDYLLLDLEDILGKRL